MATQTLLQYKPKTYELRVDGTLAPGVTAKDLILYLIGKLTTDGGTGYVLEYTGSAIRALSMEERMTVCNMSIEAGARAGLIAPDEKTIDYLRVVRLLRRTSKPQPLLGVNFRAIPAQPMTKSTSSVAKILNHR